MTGPGPSIWTLNRSRLVYIVFQNLDTWSLSRSDQVTNFRDLPIRALDLVTWPDLFTQSVATIKKAKCFSVQLEMSFLCVIILSFQIDYFRLLRWLYFNLTKLFFFTQASILPGSGQKVCGVWTYFSVQLWHWPNWTTYLDILKIWKNNLNPHYSLW